MSGAVGRSGGQRVGAGRPPKDAALKWLSGNAGKRGSRPTTAQVASRPLPSVPPPATLGARELAVWEELAPYALAGRTLTTSTAGDFAMLCVLEVECAEMLAARRLEGWTLVGVSLSREFRGLAQRLEAKRRAFKLAPMGKDMVAPEAPKDEWSEFDGPAQ